MKEDWDYSFKTGLISFCSGIEPGAPYVKVFGMGSVNTDGPFYEIAHRTLPAELLPKLTWCFERSHDEENVLFSLREPDDDGRDERKDEYWSAAHLESCNIGDGVLRWHISIEYAANPLPIDTFDDLDLALRMFAVYYLAHLQDSSSTTRPYVGSGDFAFGSTIWPGLAKLIEECGETLQIAGKLMQRGGRTDHWSGDLKPMAEDEIGDLIAATKVFCELNADRLDTAVIDRRVAAKTAKFLGWHRDNLGNPAS